MAITKEMFENFIADNNRFFLKGISESDNIIYHFSKMPIADKEHRVDAIYFVPIYRHTLPDCDTVVLNHSGMSLFALIVDKKETYSEYSDFRNLFGSPSIDCNKLIHEIAKVSMAYIVTKLCDNDFTSELLIGKAKSLALHTYIMGTDLENPEQRFIASCQNILDIQMIAGFLSEPSVWCEKYLSEDIVQAYKQHAAVYTLASKYLSEYENNPNKPETEFRRIEAAIKSFPTIRLFFELPDCTPINFIYNTKFLEAMFLGYLQNKPASIPMYGCCERNSITRQISASLVGHGCCNQKEIPFRCLTKIKHGNSTLWLKKEG